MTTGRINQITTFKTLTPRGLAETNSAGTKILSAANKGYSTFLLRFFRTLLLFSPFCQTHCPRREVIIENRRESLRLPFAVLGLAKPDKALAEILLCSLSILMALVALGAGRNELQRYHCSHSLPAFSIIINNNIITDIDTITLLISRFLRLSGELALISSSNYLTGANCTNTSEQSG
jgi:hypothetical protein